MTLTNRTAGRARAAFTLPELLVVVTVTLILMSILVQASTIITNTVLGAKVQGDFVGQERTAIAIMRRDLQATHFLDEDGKPNQGRKVSDQRTDLAAAAGGKITRYKPPKSGYFWASAAPAPVNSGSNPAFNPGDSTTWNFSEDSDASGFSSSRSGNHFMQFTIVLPGGAPEDTLTADVPFKSTTPTTGTCAEVAYFLVPNGTTPTGIAKFKLIRRQRIAARNDDDKPAYAQILNSSGAQATDPPEVMAAVARTPLTTPAQFNMFHMNDLTAVGNRVARAPIATHRVGEDVLHNHVISFELRFTGPQVTAAWAPPYGAATQWPRPFAQNTDFPYDALPYDGNYDTGAESLTSSDTNLATASLLAAPIKRIRITGVQIRLRFWNPTNRATRQTTTAVDL